MRVRLLGSIDVLLDDGPRAVPGLRLKAILAALALHPGQVVGAGRLIDLVWGERAAPARSGALQSHMSRLRRIVGDPATIVARSRGYVLDVDAEASDAQVAERLIRDSGQLSDLGRRETMLCAAVQLWRGRSLTELAELGWFDEQAERLDRLLLHARYALVDTRLALGQHVELVPELEALVSEDPHHEPAYAQLMRALYRAGRQGDALAAYQRLRRILDEDLGIAPSQPVRDLEAAILRQDATLDAPPVHQPVVARTATVPAQLPMALATFTGRSGELAQLDGARLDGARPDGARPDGAGVRVAVISGTAGVGKTALAVHWAHRVAADFPDGQLYANLGGFGPTGVEVEPAAVIQDFLEALGVPAGRIPAGVEARTALYRTRLAGKRCLLVLDNAADAAQVRPLLPGAPGCLTIVTSRRQLLSLVAAEGARLVTLDLLTEAQAGLLLASRLGAQRLAAEPEAVAEIIRRCARLPLALAIVAGRASAHPNFPLAALAAELRDAEGGLSALSAGDPSGDVRSALAWSCRTLDASVARLLRLVSRQPGPHLTVGAAASVAGLPDRPTRRMLAELADGHLIEETAPGRYTMHDLLRAFLTADGAGADAPDERRAAELRWLDHYLHSAHAAARVLDPFRDVIPIGAPSAGVTVDRFDTHARALAWFDAERPVLLVAVEHAAASGFDRHACGLAWAVADVLQRRGRWDELDATRQTAMDAALRLRSAPELAYAHRALGLTHQRKGEFAPAHAHVEQAAELYGAADDLTGVIRSHLNRSDIWHRQQRLDEALNEAQKALDLARSGSDARSVALSLNAVGWVRAQLGEHQPAVDACREALAVQRELGDRSGEAATWDSLGYAYRGLGRYALALRCYGRAVALCRDLGHRLEEAVTLTNLGDVQAERDPDAARTSWTRALAIFDDLGHPEADRLRARLG